MATLIIQGRLTARTAVLPGAGRQNGPTDMPVRRDAAGRPIIPGTAIAGVLRGLATRLAPALGLLPECQALAAAGARDGPCKCHVCRLFGEIQPECRRARDTFWDIHVPK